MKLIKIAVICITMIAMMTPMAFSGSGSTSTGGAKITIANSGSNPDLNFTPSPTTIMSWNTSATSYAVTGVSAKTDAANGKQYGVVAGSSPVYEQAASVSDGTVSLTDPSSATSLGSDWKDKAGNSAP